MNQIIGRIVVCTVVGLGMLFLTYVIVWDGEYDILDVGATVVFVIAALSMFPTQKH